MKVKKEYQNKLRWFNSWLDAGEPDCKCSLCNLKINEIEVPVIFFKAKEDLMARLHWECFKLCIEKVEE